MQARTAATSSSSNALLDTCVEAARAAAGIIRGAEDSRPSLKWEEKSGSDFVSEIDRRAESSIRYVLRESFPEATIIGEELSPSSALDAELAFVVDPLDGTTNFLHGYPQYAVSIAALARGELLAGVVYNVTAHELFTAVKGGGAQLNREPISVSVIKEPAKALIGTGFPFKKHELLARYIPQFDRVMRGTAGIRRAGSAAIDLASVACGRFDAFWELDLAPWDIAAGVLLVREAGGIVTDLTGKQATVNFGGFVAGNPVMHPWLLEIIG